MEEGAREERREGGRAEGLFGAVLFLFSLLAACSFRVDAVQMLLWGEGRGGMVSREQRHRGVGYSFVS